MLKIRKNLHDYEGTSAQKSRFDRSDKRSPEFVDEIQPQTDYDRRASISP